jgi:uncharacterized protein (TIGR03435 family)
MVLTRNVTVRTMVVTAFLTMLGTAARVGAQDQAHPSPRPPAFDDVRITRAPLGTVGTSFTYRAGRFDARNVSLHVLIRHAYGMQDSTIVGGPTWIRSDRFDLSAHGNVGWSPAFPMASAGEPSRLQLMVQSLLADRFRLVMHKEPRDIAGYRLVRLDREGSVGPGLRRSELDCAAVAMDARRARGVAQARSPVPGTARCELSRSADSITISGRSLAQFVATLSAVLGRPVLDDTGLAGNLDIHLTWAGQPTSPGSLIPSQQTSDPSRAIASAIRTQLGLELMPAGSAIEVLVVDRAERPPL